MSSITTINIKTEETKMNVVDNDVSKIVPGATTIPPEAIGRNAISGHYAAETVGPGKAQMYDDVAAIKSVLSGYYYLRVPDIIEDKLMDLVCHPLWSPRDNLTYVLDNNGLPDVPSNWGCDLSRTTVVSPREPTSTGLTIPISEYITTGAVEVHRVQVFKNGEQVEYSAASIARTAIHTHRELRSSKTNYTYTTLAKDAVPTANLVDVSAVSYSTIRTHVGPVTPVAVSKLLPDDQTKPTIVFAIMNLLATIMQFPDFYGVSTSPMYNTNVGALGNSHHCIEDAYYHGQAHINALYTTWSSLLENLAAMPTREFVVIPVFKNDRIGQLKARVQAFLGLIKKIRWIPREALVEGYQLCSAAIPPTGSTNLSYIPFSSRVTDETSSLNILFLVEGESPLGYSFDTLVLNTPLSGAFVDIAARFNEVVWPWTSKVNDCMSELGKMAQWCSAREFHEAMMYTAALSCRLPYMQFNMPETGAATYNMPYFWRLDTAGNIRKNTIRNHVTALTATVGVGLGPATIATASAFGSNWLGQITPNQLDDTTYDIAYQNQFYTDFDYTHQIELSTPAVNAPLLTCLLAGILQPIDNSAQFVFARPLSHPIRLYSYIRAMAVILNPIGISNQINSGLTCRDLFYTGDTDLTTFVEATGLNTSVIDKTRLHMVQSILLGSVHNLSLIPRINQGLGYQAITDHVSWYTPLKPTAGLTIIPMWTTPSLYNISSKCSDNNNWNSKKAVTYDLGSATFLKIMQGTEASGSPGPYFIGGNQGNATTTTQITHISQPMNVTHLYLPDEYFPYGYWPGGPSVTHFVVSALVSIWDYHQVYNSAYSVKSSGEMLGLFFAKMPSALTLKALVGHEKTMCSNEYSWKVEKSGDIVQSDNPGVIARNLTFLPL